MVVESRSFSIHNHMNSAFHVMHDLRSKNELCDITLSIGNEEFHAHKVVLAGCSPYLRAMFTNGMLETEKSLIEIHGIEAAAMEVLLDFMYSGTIEINIDNVQSILQGASMLNIHSLRNVCSNFLQLQLDSSNCLGIHSFADMFSCVELESAARQFIYQHFMDIIRTDEYLQLSEDRVNDLLCSDQLQVTSEDEVFEAALSWIEWDPLNRTPNACRLLQNVRLVLLDLHYLENVVLRCDFIRNCPKCQNMVAKSVRIKNDNCVAGFVCTRAQPQSVYVLGGRNGVDCQLGSMEKYDALHDQWYSAANMNIARTAVGCATLNGVLYVVGGECALIETQDDTLYLRSVESYDPVIKCWVPNAEMKIARSFIAVAALGQQLYAIGGEDRVCSFNVVEKYDPKTNQWAFAPSMKRKRAGAGVAVCDGKIYVAGGYDKTYHTDRASVECYDPEEQEWTFVAEMEKARSGLALVGIDHYLYALGGRSRHNDQYFNVAERYNTLTHQWTCVAPMNTARAWPAVAVFESKIFVMGGFDGSNRLRSVEIYDPEQNSWMYVNNMNISRAGCAAAVV